MAYSEPFSFASASELMPIYHLEDDLNPYFDYLFNEMVELNPAVPAVNPGVCEQVNSTANPYHAVMSSSSLTHEDFNFTNPQCFPFMENQWEEPLFVKPDPQVTAKSVAAQSYDDESYDLDLALSLNPEPQQYMHTTQPYPYYAQPAQYNIAAVYPQTMAYGQTPLSPVKAPKRHRVVEDDDDIDFSALDSEPIDFGEEEDPTGGFKLPASKSPIMEAMVVCALNGWGIELALNNRATSTTPAEVVFRVTDFNRYYKISRTICSKQRPTDDLGSRIKSLRRWFVNFPKKKDRCENAFSLTVKPSIAKKVNEIIERNSKTLGLTKRRRRQ